MNTEVRRLGPADVQAYRALALRAYGEHPDAFTATVAEREGLPLDFWLRRVDDHPEALELVVGAFREGQLVGAAGLSFEIRPKTKHKANLFGMYVAAEARGLGLGKSLVEAALNLARARRGIVVVQLTVTEGNAAAESLYARCGFTRFGVEAMAMRDPDSGAYFAKVHMACVLRSPNE